MKKIGFVFPGQGSQKVGMGEDLFESTESTKNKVIITNQLLNNNLTSLCINGPQETLTKTENAQPALFLVSAILLEHLEKEGIYPTIVAGHSLGELTAYYASKVISFKDTLELIKQRGKAMAAATPPESSGMAAVLGQSMSEINTIISPYANAPVTIANINCPGQIVISGEKQGLRKAINALKEKKAKVIPLPVSGAFHSPLMENAKNHLQKTVQKFSFSNATYPIILNRTGKPESNAEQLKENISQQVTSSVQWVKSIEYMTSRCDLIIECGSGKVLTGLIKKINPSIPTYSISNLQSMQTVINDLMTTEGVRNGN